MPAEAERKTKKDQNGNEVEVFAVDFTNGGIKQLEELKDFFGTKNLLEVIELGISVLQRAKDSESALKSGSTRRKPVEDAKQNVETNPNAK